MKDIMYTEEFIQDVQATLLDGQKSTATLLAIKATLIALCYCLRPLYVEQLMDYLPPEIGAELAPAQAKLPVTLYDFFRAVAEYEAVGLPRAIHHSRTVLVAMNTHLPRELMLSIRHELPGEFALLFQAGNFLDQLSRKEVKNVE